MNKKLVLIQIKCLRNMDLKKTHLIKKRKLIKILNKRKERLYNQLIYAKIKIIQNNN